MDENKAQNNIDEEELNKAALENKLSEEDQKEAGYHFPLGIAITMGVIVLLMIACIIVIVSLK